MTLVARKTFKNLTEKHINVIEDFEDLLEKGIANLTMSDIASKLKVSLRTLYEIAPSKEDLITTTMDRILTNIGREALSNMKDVKSPLERLRIYMRIGNEAAGPKLQKFDGDLDKIKGAKEMIDFHQNYFRKEFKFKDFIEAAAFITKVSIVSEKNNHHPEIYNIYNKVIIDLCTHDKENKITSKDYNLAKEIDKIL